MRGLLRFHFESIRLETKERFHAWYSPLVDRNSDPHNNSVVAVRRAALVARAGIFNPAPCPSGACPLVKAPVGTIALAWIGKPRVPAYLPLRCEG
jgi:hypothetical protein